MAKKTFTVIIGDLVGSREGPGRPEASRKIRLVINQVCARFRREFYAPFVFTRGMDEISGVLKRPDMSYRISSHVNEGIAPRVFRFAITRGLMDVAVSSKDARRMDGPAFHLAADAMQRAKVKNLSYCFELGFELAYLDPWLTELANLLQILRGSWTDHQLIVARLYGKLGSQKKTAKLLNITQQAVSDALRQAHWKELKRAQELMCRALGDLELNK